MAEETRIERDSMGEVRVPAAALWGAQTQRAVENFPVSGTTMEPRLIHALALIKACAARVNGRLGVLPPALAEAVAAAADEIATGTHDDQFPVDVFQTGSGTSTNMNVNEVVAVLASRAGPAIHPNDHVNAGQSSNDTVPSAIHVAATLAVTEELLPALQLLEDSLLRKSEEYADAVKAGRTHLMDATPVTFGQELHGYATTVATAAQRLDGCLPRVRELPLGGTAVGTGLNAAPGFAAAVIEELATRTGQAFTEARDHLEAQASRDSLVELSGVLRTLAVGLTRIADDLRWLASGPATGLAEIHLPDLQPGSSIMPGKVNPVVPEAVLMVGAQVVGNDAAVAWAGAAGRFELNTMLPLLARNLLESVRLLAAASRLLATRCVDGIVADRERMRRYAESSPAIATALNPLLGYDAVAAIVKHAHLRGLTIREATIELGHVEGGRVTPAQLDAALDVDAMTGRSGRG